MGGISRTVNYKGNRIDIGGHRFFSKSDRVMDWWLNMLPLQRLDGDVARHHLPGPQHARWPQPRKVPIRTSTTR